MSMILGMILSKLKKLFLSICPLCKKTVSRGIIKVFLLCTRPESFTSLMADLRQDINILFFQICRAICSKKSSIFVLMRICLQWIKQLSPYGSTLKYITTIFCISMIYPTDIRYSHYFRGLFLRIYTFYT